MKRQFVQFNTSQGQNNRSSSGEQSSEEASAQAREAAPSTEPYLSGQKQAGLRANYASPASHKETPHPAEQQEPPAASWAIRDDAPPAASWAYVDERESSITPGPSSERYTDPFMKRDEADDFLAGRVSPHQSALARGRISPHESVIEHSPFTPNSNAAVGPMQRPQQPPAQYPPRPAQPMQPPVNYVQSPSPAQQRPMGQPMRPPAPGWGPPQQPPAAFAPAQPQQPPRPMPGPPPGRNVPPPQNGYMGHPVPVGWQQQQGPLVLSNHAAAGHGYGPPPSMRDVSAGKRARKKKRFPVWFTAIAAVLLVGIAVGGYFAMPYINIVSSSTGQTATQFGGTTTGKKGSALQTTNSDSGPLLSKPTNILLLGSDTDAKFDGTYLAQTDIIVRIDPTTKYVGMLSIPRDLQVEIPGYPANKLDIAFSDGYLSQKTSNPYADGAGLAIATIEQNFGIPIDGYAWVGLDGFIKVIDTAGGVDVDVLHPMVDDTYPDDVNATTGQTHTDLTQSYGYKRLYIAPGPQHFNGVQALEYVRTRHSDLVGDFGRSVRQQQVLDQLKTKLETPDTVAKLPELATDLNGYVKTSLSLSDLASLANFARTINSSSIDRLVLGPPYSVAMTNSSNFAPVCDKIIPAIQKMFDLGTAANCIPQASANTAGVASSRTPAHSTTNQNAATANTSEPMTSAMVMSQVAQTNMLSVGSTHGDPFGIESLTDLTLMVALESFDAMTIT